MDEWKSKFTLEKRQQESKRIRDKYPDRVPILCFKAANAKDIPNIDKNKYLVPHDLTIGQFLYVIRRRIKLSPEKALFLFFGEQQILCPVSRNVGELYNE